MVVGTAEGTHEKTRATQAPESFLSFHFGHAPSTEMAEGTTGSPARGSAAPPSGGLPTGFIVVAVLLAFAGASSCIA